MLMTASECLYGNHFTLAAVKPDCSFVKCYYPSCASGFEPFTPPGQCCPTGCKKVKENSKPISMILDSHGNVRTAIVVIHVYNNGIVYVFLIDPCATVDCQPGSTCKVYQPTGEAFCDPSCDINNGGCAADQICQLNQVQCVRAPCPPVVECLDACSLAPETGPCKAAFTRFFHNAASGQCETFVYGGCQGNANNFESLEECQNACGESE